MRVCAQFPTWLLVAGGKRRRHRSNGNRNNSGARDAPRAPAAPGVAVTGVAPPAVPARPAVNAGAGGAGAGPAAGLPSFISSTRFDSVAGISDASRRGLKEVLKYELMTQVQAQTLPVIISGEDVLAKAKTGTGKTLGFLVPIVEVVLAARARGFGADNVGALILSPTRELSMQIAAEAAKLLHFQKSVGVQVVIGGVNMKTQLRRMNTQRLDIMVATPGRLIDHLQNSPGMLNRLRNIRVRY